MGVNHNVSKLHFCDLRQCVSMYQMLREGLFPSWLMFGLPIGISDPCRKLDGNLDGLGLAQLYREAAIACQALLWCVLICIIGVPFYFPDLCLS